MSESVSNLPLTTIRTRKFRATKINVSFGADRTYDLDIEVNPDRIAEDDVANDGADRPAARLAFGGLTLDDGEVRIERYMGEDELRAMAAALLTAAGKMRRIESDRRRQLRNCNSQNAGQNAAIHNAKRNWSE